MDTSVRKHVFDVFLVNRDIRAPMRAQRVARASSPRPQAARSRAALTDGRYGYSCIILRQTEGRTHLDGQQTRVSRKNVRSIFDKRQYNNSTRTTEKEYSSLFGVVICYKYEYGTRLCYDTYRASRSSEITPAIATLPKANEFCPGSSK